MSSKRLLAVSFVIACVIQVQGVDKYTDEKRPYEFGFTIDGEQHRHEKKDEKGLIMGEFGFITADGVYHVTVYATDEQGRFKILSMKNIRVKPYPSYKQSTGSARQGHALDVASEQTLTPASTTIAPMVSTSQAFKRISIEPPARSCSSCSIPTTSTAAPVIPQVPANASPNFPANSPANIPGPQIAPGNPNYPEQNQQTLGSPNYPSIVNNPSIPNRSNFPAPNSPVFSNQPSFQAPQQPQIPQFPQQNVPYQPQPQQQPQTPVNYPQKDLSLPKEPQYNVPEINAPQETPLTQVQPEAQPPQGALQSGRTPKRFDGDIPQSFVPQNNIGVGDVSQSLVPPEPPKKPVLINAQMQIVDQNTDIYKKGPGEKDGLPDGLTTDDMSTLLYTFNYTVGFHGHFEEGYTSGVKQGYYFVTGRNGVRTRVDYVADSKGFRPKITQEVLDLLSDDVPKAETEKEAKYGLKGYEFKWLYYPVESKGR